MSVTYSLESAVDSGIWIRKEYDYTTNQGEKVRIEYYVIPDEGVKKRTMVLTENSETKLDAVKKLIKSLEKLLDVPRTVVRYELDTTHGKSLISDGWSSPRNALRRLYELSAKE